MNTGNINTSNFGNSLSPLVVRHNSNTMTHKKSLSEAVSFVFEQKFSMKNKNLAN